MQKIKVEAIEECNRLHPAASPNRVDVMTRTGERYSEMVPYHHGHPRNPLTDAEIEHKFNSLTRDLLAPAQQQDLLSLVWNLERVEDISQIMPRLKI